MLEPSNGGMHKIEGHHVNLLNIWANVGLQNRN